MPFFVTPLPGSCCRRAEGIAEVACEYTLVLSQRMHLPKGYPKAKGLSTFSP